MTWPQNIPDAASPELPSNENNAAIAWTGVYTNDANGVGVGGLVRAYNGGRWGGFDVVDTVNTFDASTTTYVSVDRSDGSFDFSASSTNYDDSANFAKVETVVTSASAVTSAVDDRAGPGGVHGAADPGIAGASNTQPGEMISGYISAPTAKTYKIVVKAAHGGTFTETTTISESGTGTATFKINTTALGGTPNAVSSSEVSESQSSSNVFSAGDDIQITMSSLTSLVGMSFTMKYTRTLA